VLDTLRDPPAEPGHLVLGREQLDPLPLYAGHWLPPTERERGRQSLQKCLAVAGESGLYVTDARAFLGTP
jgi:hypothetical protein